MSYFERHLDISSPDRNPQGRECESGSNPDRTPHVSINQGSHHMR
jgi:hypothetical protein